MSSGSRQFHSESRNGCGQCKKRRVRLWCNLESPVCLNYRKRKEACDYLQGQPTLFLSSTKPATSTPSCSPSEPNNTDVPSSSIRFRSAALLPIDSPNTSTPQHAFSDVLTSILDKVYIGTTISNIGFSAWTQELHCHISQFNYIEPTLKLIQSLFQWLSGGRTISKSYISSLRYNIEAYNRFRVSNIRVTEANWLAMLIFGIGIIIFHFCVALSSSDPDINFIEMFYVLRESSKLDRRVGPYLLRSRLGTLLKRRYIVDGSVDDEVLTAIEHLDVVVCREEQSTDTRLMYCQTVKSLKSWVIMVEGCPHTWRDFIHFPEMVSEAYLQSLQEKTPLALLTFIYCVLGSPSPSYSNSPLRARDHYSELIVSLGHYIRPDESIELMCSNVGSNVV
ncbi:hypothetical protein F4776DRAFT_673198 [Hypoxylon sp. NC0597]|nr:hypothetical protein F4776DRAFT_673198 [Hypoxylon sp. NC0597]